MFPMIGGGAMPPQMIQLAQLAAQNPGGAAQILGRSGLTPGMIHPMGTPGLGDLMTGMLDKGTSINSATPGVTFGATPGASQGGGFIGAPAGGEMPPMMGVAQSMAGGPDPSMGASAEYNAATPAPEGVTVSQGVESTAPGAPQIMQALMGGLKGVSQNSSDQRPIMSANAPAPRSGGGMSAQGRTATLNALLQLIQGGGSAGKVPMLGALIGRR